MNEYRVELLKLNGLREVTAHDHMIAETAQEVADTIRKEWPGWYINRISMVVRDWK